MQKSVQIDLALPAETYAVLHAKSGALGQTISETVADLLSEKPAKPQGAKVPFLASLDAKLHARIKAAAAERGQSMRAFIAESCARACGMECEQ